MDTDDEDDYPLVRLNPASKAEIYESFPHKTTSMAAGKANENVVSISEGKKSSAVRTLRYFASGL